MGHSRGGVKNCVIVIHVWCSLYCLLHRLPANKDYFDDGSVAPVGELQLEEQQILKVCSIHLIFFLLLLHTLADVRHLLALRALCVVLLDIAD